MSLKIEAHPELTSFAPPKPGQTGERILAQHRKAKTTAALVAGVKASVVSSGVQRSLDIIAGRASV
jgi:hypothetical protein